jgi:hypothetical protein
MFNDNHYCVITSITDVDERSGICLLCFVELLNDIPRAIFDLLTDLQNDNQKLKEKSVNAMAFAMRKAVA